MGWGVAFGFPLIISVNGLSAWQLNAVLQWKGKKCKWQRQIEQQVLVVPHGRAELGRVSAATQRALIVTEKLFYFISCCNITNDFILQMFYVLLEQTHSNVLLLDEVCEGETVWQRTFHFLLIVISIGFRNEIRPFIESSHSEKWQNLVKPWKWFLKALTVNRVFNALWGRCCRAFVVAIDSHGHQAQLGLENEG